MTARTSTNYFRTTASRCAIVGIFLVAGCADAATPSSMDQGSATNSTSGTAIVAGTVTPPADSPTGISVSYPISLPSGYNDMGGLAADPYGGLWGFAQGSSAGTVNETVFHWASTGSLTASVSISALGSAYATGADSPLTVDLQGNAWLGIRHSVIELDDSGVVRVVALPDVPVASSDSGLPHPPQGPGSPEAEGFTNVESLAVNSSGDIVVGRRFGLSLQTISESGTVISVPLPAGTSLSGESPDVAGSGIGSTATALYTADGTHELGLLSTSGWSVKAPTCQPYRVHVAYNIITTDGYGCAAQLSALTTDAETTTLPASADEDSARLAAYSLGDDEFLAGPVTGGADIDSSQSIDQRISLGTIAVAPPGISHTASDAPRGIEQIPVQLGSVVPTKSDGIVWFVPAQGGTEIGRIAT